MGSVSIDCTYMWMDKNVSRHGNRHFKGRGGRGAWAAVSTYAGSQYHFGTEITMSSDADVLWHTVILERELNNSTKYLRLQASESNVWNILAPTYL